jgi:hypothetical protein
VEAEHGLPATAAVLQATGVAPGEALALLAPSFGQEAVLAAVAEALRAMSDTQPNCSEQVVSFLDEVAQADPPLAQAGLLAWGQGRIVPRGLNLSQRAWVTALPEGMTIQGHLNLHGALLLALPKGLVVCGNLFLGGSGVMSLPEGLWVYGFLYLDDTGIQELPRNLKAGCLDLGFSQVATLPEGLIVEDLALSSAPRWDGCIPESAQVTGLVVTDQHLDGLGLEAWRERYPEGEASE